MFGMLQSSEGKLVGCWLAITDLERYTDGTSRTAADPVTTGGSVAPQPIRSLELIEYESGTRRVHSFCKNGTSGGIIPSKTFNT